MTRRTERVSTPQGDGNLDAAWSALLEAVEDATTMTTSNAAEDPQEDVSALPTAFLRLFSSGSDRVLLKEGLTARDQKQLLFQAIQSFPKATARRFFSALHGHVHRVLESESFLPDSAFPDEDDNEDDNNGGCGSLIEVTPDPASTAALHFLSCAALCVQAYVDRLIDNKKEKTKRRNQDDDDGGEDENRPARTSHVVTTKVPIIVEAYQIAQELHDALLLFNSAGPDALPTQANVMTLCETWWSNNVEHKDSLILQVLPLLVHSVINDDTKSAIKRLYNLRDAIQGVDMDCPESHVFKSGLLHLASSPRVLKFPEGKKLLSYLLQQDHVLLRGLHKAIRAQIPGLRGPLLTAFGECYLRAWKDAPPPNIRESIESIALQDLAHTAVHTAKPTLLKSLLVVLEPFHSDRKNPEVEKLLFRLYSGMIWRSLSTANAKIRVNATHVFAQVFPLRDASSAQTENAIRKATDALETLLQDPDPSVRVAAAQATAHILPTYWDVLPPQEIREILNLVVLEHASDRSSSAVRSAAVDAISSVLDAPQSHGVLRPLLPLMGNLIHDRAEKVRIAVVRLLVKVKNTRGIKYYHVVPVDHLVGRLEAEAALNASGPVPRRLTGLMVNSFCPHGPQARSHDQVKRAIKFVSEQPNAAKVFYANLPRHVPFRVAESLVSNLSRYLHGVVRSQEARDESSIESEEETAAGDAPHSETMSVVVMTNLVETMAGMLQSMKLPTKSKRVSAMVGSTTLLDLLKFFETYLQSDADGEDEHFDVQDIKTRGITALLSCIRNQPSDSLSDLAAHSKHILSSFTDEQARTVNAAPYFCLLCLAGRTDDAASSLASSIASSFEKDFTLNFASPEAGSRKRKTSKNGKAAHSIPDVAPKVALAALSKILMGENCDSATARKSFFASNDAIRLLEGALARGTKHAEQLLRISSRGSATSDEEVEYVLDMCEAYGRFCLHKDAFLGSEGQASDSNFKELLQWFSNTLLPRLASNSGTENLPFIDPDLSRISVEKSFDGRMSSPMPSGPPRRRSNRNATPVRLDANEFADLGTPPPSTRHSERSRAIAISLSQSFLILLSERVAIDPSTSGFVEEVALQWLIVSDSEAEVLNLEAFRIAFSRLAFCLCKHSSSFVLLENILTKLGESDDSNGLDPVARVVERLLSNKGKIALTSESILTAARSLYHKEIEDLPAGFDDLFSAEGGCVRSALMAAISSKAGCFDIANRTIMALSHDFDTSVQMLHANLLFLLCDVRQCKFAAEVRIEVRGLNLGEACISPRVMEVLKAIDLENDALRGDETVMNTP